ncbi:exported hypothetical protein [Candidatus Terasakiella magnetica]|uniref:Solute-binding protein family 3/N-terminal domain-containing protein n=1 Tax=Candidatus Terasakiella magnetica TaxID=1867952 RepID=A0A1C3RFB1_9PROT|nr:transporter substrate-binding domain-containing protein [Candidatus Terasakiella magnetica]SCA55970.1 exported hypothetical protein [Candidatus Terasakiella magnetica]
MRAGKTLPIGLFFVMFCLVAGMVPVKAQNVTIALNSWCPHVCVPQVDSNRLGYTTEIIEKSLVDAGYSINYVKAPWATIVKMARDGKVDIVGSAYKQELPTMLFVEMPSGMAVERVFSLKSNPWSFKGVSSLSQISKIGTIEGADYNNPELMDYLKKAENVAVFSGHEIVKQHLTQLMRQRIEAFIGDEFVTLWNAKKLSSTLEVKSSPPVSGLAPLYVAVSPSHPEHKKLLKIINDGITASMKTGEFAKVLGTYNLTPWWE